MIKIVNTKQLLSIVTTLVLSTGLFIGCTPTTTTNKPSDKSVVSSDSNSKDSGIK